MVRLIKRQISVVLSFGFSVTGASKCTPLSSKVRDTPCALSISSSVISRVLTALDSGGGGGAGKLDGIELVSLLERDNDTLNCIIRGSSTPPPPGNGAGALLVNVTVWPAIPLKSRMTSARSAGATRISISCTGLGKKPSSAPIWMKGCAESSDSRKKRALQPFRMRKRYFLGSTFRNGITLPFTSAVLPKNSGTQTGCTGVTP